MMKNVLILVALVAIYCYAAMHREEVKITLDEVPSEKRNLARRVVHGVPSSEFNTYVAGIVDETKSFTCGGWGNRISLRPDQLNDDFCDCVDGSDEPGTAACANSKFYCRNKGHLGKYIFSSRVRDGVCDCCDGSDEFDISLIESEGKSSSVCKDSCAEEANAYWKEHAADIKRHEEGAVLKKELVIQAAETIRSYRAEVNVLEQRLKRQETEVEDAKKMRDAARDADAASKDRREKETRSKLLRMVGLNDNVSLEQLQDMLHRIAAKGSEGEPATIVSEAKSVRKSPASSKEPADDAEKKSVHDRMKEALAAVGDENVASSIATTPIERSDFNAFIGIADMNVSELQSLIFSLAAKSDAWEAKVLAGRKTSSEASGDDDETIRELREKLLDGYKTPEYQNAENAYTESNNKLRSTKNDLEEKKKLIGSSNWGAHNEWLPLKDKCFEKKVGEYVYKVCVGKEAKQGTTNLGRFDRMETSADELKMYFTNGQKCWNGPKRSMTVTVRCNLQTQLVAVEEPSMCTYTSILESPAACDLQYAQRRRYDLEEHGGDDGKVFHEEL